MRLASALLSLSVLCACRQDMHDQPRYLPLQYSAFFADGRASRPIPAESVARGDLDRESLARTGLQNGAFAPELPFPVDLAVLERGQERFDIYCAPCHGYLGNGDGMIARRGFLNPSNLHTDRVRRSPPGYLFQVISNGFGAMPEYRDQIPASDRWKIIAYLRALDLSQNAAVDELPPAQRAALAQQEPQ